ncbi:ABC transporter substrate-binding protein [Roseitalea porphyridii]|uniref:Amino acid ABC transporter substrate-binding protein n=1 Tax=Roseitalea porphyridii TaxID=1852022 RepID=A0A4P6UVF3_9HYPH|nr:ABC transporter substrate-binding protein [Roseitalea porphyridii]QBK29131.1 amino acid ABC transporter substrate-binding protein [Roseitalea porphyridii]
MNQTRRTFLATGAAATAALGMPAILRAQPSEYVIGASLPLTGPFATAGQLVAPVFTMARQLINDEGGIAGTPIRFVTEDSGYIPQNALANYQRALATEGDALVAYFGDSTGFMKLVAPELTGDQARLMGSTSFASELANPATNPYQYLAGPTYQDQFDILLQNIKDQGGSSVAFIFSNTEFGRDPIEHGKMRAEELGIEVVLEETTKAQGADIPTHVTKLAQSGAEYAILQGYVTGVWPQLIGGARQFGLPTQFMGTFWGMEKLIADRVTEEAGPFLDGYQGVMPYRYFYDREDAPRYQTFAAMASEMFAGTPLENYMSTWALQTMCALDIAIKALRDTAEAGQELTADNLSAALSGISDWDTGGFFGGPVTMENNKIGTGRVYQYSAESRLFTPTSDWFTV